MATNDIDAEAAWQMVDHVCRNCLSRILVRARADGRTIARCSGCEVEKIDGPEAICFCAALPEKFKIGLRCVRNKHVTAETPDAIVFVEATGDASAGPINVSYFTMEGVAKRYFRCEGYRATLSTDACAAQWRKSQHFRLGYEASPLFDGAVIENCVRFPWQPGHVNAAIPLTRQSPPRSAISATIDTLKRRWQMRQ